MDNDEAIIIYGDKMLRVPAGLLRVALINHQESFWGKKVDPDERKELSVCKKILKLLGSSFA